MKKEDFRKQNNKNNFKRERNIRKDIKEEKQKEYEDIIEGRNSVLEIKMLKLHMMIKIKYLCKKEKGMVQ